MSLKEKSIDLNKKFMIALDGPSAAGKGHIGKALAEKYQLKYVQSSIVYRGLAYVCIEDGIDCNNKELVINLAKSVDVIARVEGVDLNQEQIGLIASKISVIAEVRNELNLYLRRVVLDNPRLIMEGRDIGSVVAPDSDLKLFITADVNIRAKRRYKQLISEGKECMMADVLESLKQRDERDTKRASDPLVKAEGAYLIDTTDLTPVEVMTKIDDIISSNME